MLAGGYSGSSVTVVVSWVVSVGVVTGSAGVVTGSAGVRLAGSTLFPDVSGHEGEHGQVSEMPPLLAE